MKNTSLLSTTVSSVTSCYYNLEINYRPFGNTSDMIMFSSIIVPNNSSTFQPIGVCILKMAPFNILVLLYRRLNVSLSLRPREIILLTVKHFYIFTKLCHHQNVWNILDEDYQKESGKHGLNVGVKWSGKLVRNHLRETVSRPITVWITVLAQW